MKKKNFLPIQLFLILEKTKIIYFFSKNSKFKTLFFFFNSNFLKFISIALKMELLLNRSSLIETSALDSKQFNNDFFFFKKKILLIFYNFFSYNNNFHLFFFFFKNKKIVYSIDKIFLNSCWLERELSEMYGLIFFNKKDLRKLLLDYSKNENPLLKDFPCEGISDVYYNFFDSQINYLKNEVVEL